MDDIRHNVIYMLSDLDKLIAYLVAICSVSVAAYVYFIGHNTGYLNAVHIVAVLLVLAFSLIWLCLRKRVFDLNSLGINLHCSGPKFKLFILFAILFYCISVIAVLLREEPYSRPLLYFVCMSISAGCLFSAIVYSRPKRTHVLMIFCIILLYAVNLRVAPLVLFPNVVGTDPWFYQFFTTQIISGGHIPTGYDYSRLPIFPLEVAITAIISTMGYKYACFSSIGVIQVVVDLLAVYIIGLRLFGSKIGLISALVVSFSCHHINRGFEIIANTLGGSIIVILVLILLFFEFKNRFVKYSMVILFMMLLIMCHTIASVTFLSLLAGYYFLCTIYGISHASQKYSSKISYLFLLIFVILTLLWWSYASGHLGTIVESIAWGLKIDTHSMGSLPVSSGNEKLISYAGMLLGFSASFTGFYFMISPKYNSSKSYLSFIFAGIGIILLAIGFFPYLGGLNILGYRWWYVAQIFLAIPLSLTICIILISFGSTNKSIIVMSILISGLAFLMIISPISNPDNHALTPISAERTSFIESEILGAQFASTYYSGLISSDYLFSTCKSSSLFGNLFQRDYADLRSLDGELVSGAFKMDNSMKILRQYTVSNNFRTGHNLAKIHYDPRNKLEMCGFSKIYSSADVYMYL
jgi:hypothetical protein